MAPTVWSDYRFSSTNVIKLPLKQGIYILETLKERIKVLFAICFIICSFKFWLPPPIPSQSSVNVPELVSKEILNFNLKFPLTEPRLPTHNAHPPPSASSSSLAPSHFRKQKYTLLTSRAEMTQQTSCIKVLPTKYLIFNQRCRNEIHFSL